MIPVNYSQIIRKFLDFLDNPILLTCTKCIHILYEVVSKA